jgi:hypothetical protein
VHETGAARNDGVQCTMGAGGVRHSSTYGPPAGEHEDVAGVCDPVDKPLPEARDIERHVAARVVHLGCDDVAMMSFTRPWAQAR